MISDPPIRRAVLAHAACLLSSLVLPMRAPARAATNPELAAAAAAVPAAEARLVELSQGRRLSSWTAEERPVVDALVDELVMLGRQATWRSARAANGDWSMAAGPQDVLYPGTGAAALPDLQWSDHQIVGLCYVIQLGELAGRCSRCAPQAASPRWTRARSFHQAPGAEATRRFHSPP